MKSKKLLLVAIGVVLLLIVLIPFGIKRISGPLSAPLEVETLDNQFPDRVDVEDAANGPSWVTLPFGYTLGPWPTRFRDNPIVMKMTYQKGPPQKFIQQMTQVWDPINAELTLEGPKTPAQYTGLENWKYCFSATYRCISEKRKFFETTLKDLEKWKADSWKLTWFESADPLAPRGVHARLEMPKFQVDRYVVITEKGVTQNFTLKTVREPVGLEAQILFLKVLGAMKVKDDLSNARAWILTKLKGVNLNQVQNILNPKLRYAKLIQVQNELFSQLSVDPTQVAPFFHLAGVTHILAVAMIKTKFKAYEQQESWITQAEPLLTAILKYVGDFPATEPERKNIESLLQDILLLEQKLSK